MPTPRIDALASQGLRFKNYNVEAQLDCAWVLAPVAESLSLRCVAVSFQISFHGVRMFPE